MFYRRKLVLALLQVSGNHLSKLSIQKFLFLVSRHQKVKSYDFVPYRFGCYSFQAVADIGTLKKYHLISENIDGYAVSTNEDFLMQLKDEDRSAVLNVNRLYGQMSNEELMRVTYVSYPYYAINSTVAKSILSTEQYARVERQRPIKYIIKLYTIGYEGQTLESYLNKLIINDIRLLCDVRCNSLSMKFGFSKGQLRKSCEAVGIKYIHLPEVGIKSNKRQQLVTQHDYDVLFDDYKETTLRSTTHIQKYVLSLIAEYKRVALTCFEANVCQCHRKPLAEAIAKLPGWQYELSHI